MRRTFLPHFVILALRFGLRGGGDGAALRPWTRCSRVPTHRLFAAKPCWDMIIRSEMLDWMQACSNRMEQSLISSPFSLYQIVYGLLSVIIAGLGMPNSGYLIGLRLFQSQASWFGITLTFLLLRLVMDLSRIFLFKTGGVKRSPDGF